MSLLADAQPSVTTNVPPPSPVPVTRNAPPPGGEGPQPGVEWSPPSQPTIAKPLDLPKATEPVPFTVYDPKLWGDVDPETGRPANIPAKYWDYKKREARLWDMAEQYKYQEKRLGEKSEKPPEKYALPSDPDWTAPEGLDSDPRYVAVAEVLNKEAHLSQKLHDKIIRSFFSASGEMEQAAVTREIEALGPEAPVRIDGIKRYLAANAPSEIYADAMEGGFNAAGIRTVEWLIKQSLPGTLERDGSLYQADTDQTLEEMQMAKDDYGQRRMLDPAYAAAYRNRLAAHVTRKGRG